MNDVIAAVMIESGQDDITKVSQTTQKRREMTERSRGLNAQYLAKKWEISTRKATQAPLSFGEDAYVVTEAIRALRDNPQTGERLQQLWSHFNGDNNFSEKKRRTAQDTLIVYKVIAQTMYDEAGPVGAASQAALAPIFGDESAENGTQLKQLCGTGFKDPNKTQTVKNLWNLVKASVTGSKDNSGKDHLKASYAMYKGLAPAEL